jgi:diacylglycerol kinase
MTTEQGANVVFGGDATGATAAARQAADAVKNSVGQMKASLEGLQGQFAMVTRGLAAITAAVAGGAAMRQFVADADHITRSAIAMGRGLGISTTEASTFGVALRLAGIDAENVASAGKRVTMALSQGGEKFAALGVKVKDSNGAFRDSRDIMMDVNAKLMGFREGTDRNIEANKIYGREYTTLTRFINEFKGETEETRQAASDLNLVVGVESVAASDRYKESKAGMDLVMKGISRTIGEALIPGLTSMADFFKSEGPAAVTVMRGVMSTYLVVQDSIVGSVKALWSALKGAFSAIGESINGVFGVNTAGMTGMRFFANLLSVLQAAVVIFGTGLAVSFELVGSAIAQTVDWIVTFGEIVEKVIVEKDFAGATKAWEDGFKRREKIVADSGRRILEIAAKGSADLEKALMNDPLAKGKVTPTTSPADSSGKRAVIKAKDDNTGAIAKAGMDAALALQKQALAEATRLNAEQHDKELSSDRAFYAQKLVIENAGLDSEAAGKKAELAQNAAQQRKVEAGDVAKLNGLKAAQLKIEGELALIGMKRRDAAVVNERELAKALDDRNKKLVEQDLAYAKKLADIDIAGQEEKIRVLKEFGQITETEELALHAQLAAARYAAERQALTDRLALLTVDAAERRRIAEELFTLEMEYQGKQVKLANDTAIAKNKPIMDFQKTMQGQFQSGLDSMFDRSKTFGAKMKAMWMSMATTYVQMMVTKPVAAYLAGESTKLMASSGMFRALAALMGFSTGASIVSKKAEAASVIPAEAGIAAGAAAASVASVPYVGPALAAAAYAETYAMVIGGLVAASASGGYDIPAGVNPITQLHAREMVLPAKQADAVRAMAEGGGGGGGAVALHVQAIDAQSVERLFRNNGDALVKALRSAQRNGKFV